MEYGGFLGAFPEEMVLSLRIWFRMVMIWVDMTSALWGNLEDAFPDGTWKRGFGNGEFMFINFSVTLFRVSINGCSQPFECITYANQRMKTHTTMATVHCPLVPKYYVLG